MCSCRSPPQLSLTPIGFADRRLRFAPRSLIAFLAPDRPGGFDRMGPSNPESALERDIVVSFDSTNDLKNGNSLQHTRKIFEQSRIIRELFVNFRDRTDDADRISGRQQIYKFQYIITIDRAEHF